MGAFEGLLREVATSVKGLSTLQEDILERMRALEKDVSAIKIEQAKAREAHKWDHKERRKVDGRLETGDHTFEKLATEIKTLESANQSVINTVQRVNKRISDVESRISVSSNRRFALMKMAIGAALTAALAVFTAWATAKFSAPQIQAEKKVIGGSP